MGRHSNHGTISIHDDISPEPPPPARSPAAADLTGCTETTVIDTRILHARRRAHQVALAGDALPPTRALTRIEPGGARLSDHRRLERPRRSVLGRFGHRPRVPAAPGRHRR